MAFHAPQEFRQKHPAYGIGEGNNGYFVFTTPGKGKVIFHCIASDEMGWEHVSVSLSKESRGLKRTPTWEEMCQVKDVFWDTDDWVIQYHPEKKKYINMFPYALHLWRPVGQDFPTPPPILVGLK